MYFFMVLYASLLFFLLSPGVLVTLPSVSNMPKSSDLYVTVLVHSVIFSLIYYLTYKFIWRTFYERRLN